MLFRGGYEKLKIYRRNSVCRRVTLQNGISCPWVLPADASDFLTIFGGTIFTYITEIVLHIFLKNDLMYRI